MASSPSLIRTCAGSGARVVLVHGFTQTGASFDRLAGSLAATHEVCTVDLPGHGHAREIGASSLEATARLVGEAGGRATYVGYSLGGRVCLTLALERPELVERLVLVGASPGIDDEEERAARRGADEALADRLEARAAAGEGVADFLREWLSGPLFAHLDAQQAGVEARLENTLVGLAASLRATGAGTQVPARGRLAQLTMPILLVAGDRDAKFTALAAEMAASIGGAARVELVPDAGHAACFEQPEVFERLLRDFLRSTEAAPGR